MINRTDIVQGSLEWHEIRWCKIGGTLSKGLFVNSDTLFLDILSQHLEEFEPTDSFENYDMQRGKEMEPFAIEYASIYTGLNFTASGWLQSEENPLLGLSPDAITDCEKYALESKCLSRKEHTEIIYRNEIPKEKIPQLVHYFTVNPKLEKLYFIAFRPESIKHFIAELTRDSLVDMGWKKKVEVKVIGKRGVEIAPKIETVTDIRPISEWCEIAIEKANEMQVRIEETVKQLNF